MTTIILPYGRLFLFVVLFMFIFAMIFLGIFKDKNLSLTPYLCNTTQSMIECRGPEDAITCVAVPNPFNCGLGMGCAPLANGYQLGSGFDISVS